jgi:riboflavin synthase
MFTGIVETTGRVARIDPRGGDVRLLIDAGTLDLGDVAIGDSVAVSGVCLTAVAIEDARTLAFDVSIETLSRTSLGSLVAGVRVNLEKALRLADRLGGHFVSGHVDGLGRVAAIDRTRARSAGRSSCRRISRATRRRKARSRSTA